MAEVSIAATAAAAAASLCRNKPGSVEGFGGGRKLGPDSVRLQKANQLLRARVELQLQRKGRRRKDTDKDKDGGEGYMAWYSCLRKT